MTHHSRDEDWGNRVAGRCPACGSRNLFVAVGHHVTCGLIGCPDPCLVADYLEGHNDIPHHVVEFKPDSWHLEHPLRCRLQGLRNCLIDAAIQRLESPPKPLGEYRVEMVSGQLFYDEAADAS